MADPGPLPHATRVYAHVHTFDIACPACGVINQCGGKLGRRKHTPGRRRLAGYDALSGVLTCRGCRRPWYVGVVLWGLLPGPRGRPADHVPGPRELAQLRGWGKDREAAGGRKGARAEVNLVCWCGVSCPAHGKGDEDDGEVVE